MMENSTQKPYLEFWTATFSWASGAGRWQTQLPVSPKITSMNKQRTHNHSGLRKLCSFPRSGQRSTNDRMHYFKTDSVLDGFAQL